MQVITKPVFEAINLVLESAKGFTVESAKVLNEQMVKQGTFFVRIIYFQKEMSILHQNADKSKMIAAVVLAASVFFGVLGLMFSAALGNGFMGLGIFLLAWPSSHRAYNCYRMADNVKKIALENYECWEVAPKGIVFDKNKVSKSLLEGTYRAKYFGKDYYEELMRYFCGKEVFMRF